MIFGFMPVYQNSSVKDALYQYIANNQIVDYWTLLSKHVNIGDVSEEAKDLIMGILRYNDALRLTST
jgi:hypothetical protein